MSSPMSRPGYGFVCVLAAVAVAASCSAPAASAKPDAPVSPASVTALVELPVFLGFGDAALQRRVQRRAGDALIGLSGGRAILAEELPSAVGTAADPSEIDDKQVGERVKALGEAPENTLAFAVVASRNHRSVPNASPLAGFRHGSRVVTDYIVRLEVRQAGRPDVLGTVDAIATSEPNEREIGARGESLGVQKAIDEALAKAVRTFAPRLMARGASGELIAEIPAAAAGSARDRAAALGEIYPELPLADVQAFVQSRERFLVIRPGALAGLGLAAGDFLALPVGQTLTSRAALARSVARGEPVKLVVERAGQRYVLASAER
jgi:hypothetical protein